MRCCGPVDVTVFCLSDLPACFLCVISLAMSASLSVSRIRSRIQRLVEQHATDEAKNQLKEEKAWRKEHERNNRRDEIKERRPVTEQTPILSRLETEGLQELWDFVKDNKREVYQNEYCRRQNSPCWMWKAEVGGKKGSGQASPFTTKQGYGYISLIGLGKTSLMVTHLALWTRCSTLQPSRRFHVSHRCHTPACFNPDHLCQEHRELNSVRNRCLAFRDEECLISDCIHSPPCIVAFKENEHRVKDKSTVHSTLGPLLNITNAPGNRKRKLSSSSSSSSSSSEENGSSCIDLTSD